MLQESIAVKDVSPFHISTPSELLETPKEYQDLVKRQLTAHAEGELSGADDYVKLFYFLTNDPYEKACLLYTSPSPRDLSTSRMPSSA